MAVVKLHDDRRDRRDEADEALRSYWVLAYLGLYLTPEERERFRGLDAEEVLDLVRHIKRMRRRGFDPVLAREVRRAVLAPGEPDVPVGPRAQAGALFGPPAEPPAPLPPDPKAAAAPPRPSRARGRGRRRDDPGQRLLPFMTPRLVDPD